jgi:hypothetical protein
MKSKVLVLVLVSTLLSGCLGFKDYLVESDYSYRSNFKKYGSYDFLIEANPEFVNEVTKPILEEAIKYRMKLMGYKHTDKSPDLLVYYKIFDEDLKYQGYNQPDINQWLKSENEEEPYDAVKYQLRNGTLLIQMVDNKRRSTVWQGYASGLQQTPFTSNDRILKNAVISIFDKYRVFVEGENLPNEKQD